MRRLLVLVAAVGLVVVVVIGLTQAGGQTGSDGTDFDLPAAKQALATAPAPLNGIYAQANELLGGGQEAFDARIDALKGTPLVINKWASWCGPCQAEFPVFQAAALKHGKEVGFIGLNSEDADTKARKFLAERPLPFPSYTDPGEEIARNIEAPKNFPMTVFVNPDGKTHIHSGPYQTEADLDADIDRYAS